MITPEPQSIVIEFGRETLELRGDSTIWLPRFRSLLVSDLHLGKDASFRAAGVPVPKGMDTTILDLLSKSIDSVQPEQVVILGDLVHDEHSLTDSLVDSFARLVGSAADIQFELVRGNHDRHVAEFPPAWKLKTCGSKQLGSITLVHELISDQSINELFQIGGHTHPVIQVGRGADQMRLPCFVVDHHSITLPAFGPFKGGMLQTPKHDKVCFPVCENQIWQAAAPSRKRAQA